MKFICKKCGRESSRKQSLTKHVFQHVPSDQWPYSCPLPECDWRGKFLSDYRPHRRSKSHQCEKARLPGICDETPTYNLEGFVGLDRFITTKREVGELKREARTTESPRKKGSRKSSSQKASSSSSSSTVAGQCSTSLHPNVLGPSPSSTRPATVTSISTMTIAKPASATHGSAITKRSVIPGAVKSAKPATVMSSAKLTEPPTATRWSPQEMTLTKEQLDDIIFKSCRESPVYDPVLSAVYGDVTPDCTPDLETQEAVLGLQRALSPLPDTPCRDENPVPLPGAKPMDTLMEAISTSLFERGPEALPKGKPIAVQETVKEVSAPLVSTTSTSTTETTPARVSSMPAVTMPEYVPTPIVPLVPLSEQSATTCSSRSVDSSIFEPSDVIQHEMNVSRADMTYHFNHLNTELKQMLQHFCYQALPSIRLRVAAAMDTFFGILGPLHNHRDAAPGYSPTCPMCSQMERLLLQAIDITDPRISQPVHRDSSFARL